MSDYASAPEGLQQYVRDALPSLDILAAHTQDITGEIQAILRDAGDELRKTFSHVDDTTLAAIALYVFYYAGSMAMNPAIAAQTSTEVARDISVTHGLLAWELAKVVRGG